MRSSADIVPSLEVSFLASPPVVLDVACENLPLAGYIVGALSIVSSLEALLGIPILRSFLFLLAMVVSQPVLSGVTRQVFAFLLLLLVVNSTILSCC